MFQEEVTMTAQAAAKKSKFLTNNAWGYFAAAMLAGIYVGLGILLITTIGGVLGGAPATKIVMGAAFGVALSLVIFAGAELFTGNNLVMTVGLVRRTVTLRQTLWLWLVCFAGNWAGSILLALLFLAGGFGAGAVGEFIAAASAAKAALPFFPLLVRGILCNILVCLAVWCGFRCKTESARLVMIFWCLFVFITVGMEHSIANMSLLSIALFNPLTTGITAGGYLYNILVVTLGNMVGGIVFVAFPYLLISRQQEH
ncbi:MAG: formate/nitrite transporter family protein [Anaerolineae bacterium]|jgi:nitrite transporter NirC|nr:formate/nitrite transporter family protein [Anaerolineae bacterium]